MNRTTTKCDEVNPIITFKNELKRIFEGKFSGKIGTNFSPFFTRIEENFDGKTGYCLSAKQITLKDVLKVLKRHFLKSMATIFGRLPKVVPVTTEVLMCVHHMRLPKS